MKLMHAVQISIFGDTPIESTDAPFSAATAEFSPSSSIIPAVFWTFAHPAQSAIHIPNSMAIAMSPHVWSVVVTIWITWLLTAPPLHVLVSLLVMVRNAPTSP
jgi:hypothetical protein